MPRIKTAALTAAGLLFLGTALVWAAAPAKLAEVSGAVQVKRTSSGDWVAAKSGEELPEGSQLLTGADASCQILLGPDHKSAVKLHPNTKAVLSSLDPVKIDLESGKALSMVRNLRKGSTFQVKTPTALAGVRGTGWDQTAEKVNVFEDTVDLTGQGGQEVRVPEGKGVEIGDDGSFGEFFDVPESEKAEWNDFKKDAGEAIERESKEKDAGGSADAFDALGETSSGPLADAPSDPGAAAQDAKGGLSESQDQQRVEDMIKPEDKKPGNYF